MSAVIFDEAYKRVLEPFLLDRPAVVPGKMFGYSVYYSGGKLFASLYEEGFCVKVVEAMTTKLLEREGIEPFSPRGRTLREWISIVLDREENLLEKKEHFDASIADVPSLAGS